MRWSCDRAHLRLGAVANMSSRACRGICVSLSRDLRELNPGKTDPSTSLRSTQDDRDRASQMHLHGRVTYHRTTVSCNSALQTPWNSGTFGVVSYREPDLDGAARDQQPGASVIRCSRAGSRMEAFFARMHITGRPEGSVDGSQTRSFYHILNILLILSQLRKSSPDLLVYLHLLPSRPRP